MTTGAAVVAEPVFDDGAAVVEGAELEALLGDDEDEDDAEPALS